MAKRKPVVTSLQAYARVAVLDVEPVVTEVILSSYVREARLFKPEYCEITFSISASETEIDWPANTVHGWAEGNRGDGRLTRRATVKLAEDSDALIDGKDGIAHWPAYARQALLAARKVVKL